MQNETTLSIPDSQNKATGGFWDTIRPHADAVTAWRLVFSAIVEACDGADIERETIQTFLDCHYGWKLAETVIDQMQDHKRPLAKAIEAAVEAWRSRPYYQGGKLYRDSDLYKALKRCELRDTTRLSLPDSQNKAEGFWGAISAQADAATAWRLAFSVLVEVTDGADTSRETIRAFLDSVYGRDLAEDIIDQLQDRNPPLMEAVETAVEKWLDWTIPRTMESETGMRRGHSYLDGVLKRCEALATGA